MKGFFVLTALATLLFSCESVEQKEKRLAEQHCGSCHLFPEPNLLPKHIWTKGVLPNMAFRMGLVDLMDAKRNIPKEDLMTVVGTLPNSPMVSEQEWKDIVNYFEKNAPTELTSIGVREIQELSLFKSSKYKNSQEPLPLVTLIKADTTNKKIIVGTRTANLYIYSNEFEIESTQHLTSPVSHLEITEDNEFTLSLMGIMDPNDRAVGEVITTDKNGSMKDVVIDSLQRPVFFEKADLNSDGLEDFVICAFGNYTGGLLVYENKGNLNFNKHTISNLPGSRKTIIKDFTNDGKLDILSLLTQGDEQITLFINEGDFKFKQKVLLKFPPVYGSSYFEVADFNQDGRFDILYTNGDNSDYSLILKPYHGVKIFLQDSDGNFIESWSYQMHGASQAMAFDFDQDGDLDIAAISFFSDFTNHPEEGFLYFENTNMEFKPYQLKDGATGRWVVMEVADIEGDGDKDIILGALDFAGRVPPQLFEQWKQNQTSLLVLENLTR